METHFIVDQYMRIFLPASKSRIRPSIAFFDFFWLAFSPFIALWLRDPSFIDPHGLPFHVPITYQYAFISSLSSLPIFIIFRLKEGQGHQFSSRDALTVLVAVICCVISSVFSVFFFSRLEGIPRSVPIIFGLVLMSGILVYRLLLRSIYENKNNLLCLGSSKTDSIYYKRRIIIVGLDGFSIRAVRLIDYQKPRTLIVVSIITHENNYISRRVSGISVISGLDDIGSIIDEYKIHGVFIDEVWVSDNAKNFNEILFSSLNKACMSREVKCKKLSHALNLEPVIVHEALQTEDKSVLSCINNSYFRLKRLLDVIFSAFLFFFLAPIIIILIVTNYIFLGFPIIFWQERVGRYGNIIRIYKFRSMTHKNYLHNQKPNGCSELSNYGMFLRRLHLDEIPQLVNILVGEMSVVGPRPLLPVDQPKNKKVRLFLRPGITGWAQIHGGNKLTPEEKNALDCWYVYNASFKLDLLIIYKTVLVVLFGMERNEKAIQRAVFYMKDQINADDKY